MILRCHLWFSFSDWTRWSDHELSSLSSSSSSSSHWADFCCCPYHHKPHCWVDARVHGWAGARSWAIIQAGVQTDGQLAPGQLDKQQTNSSSRWMKSYKQTPFISVLSLHGGDDGIICVHTTASPLCCVFISRCYRCMCVWVMHIQFSDHTVNEGRTYFKPQRIQNWITNRVSCYLPKLLGSKKIWPQSLTKDKLYHQETRTTFLFTYSN